jgi:antitoxin YefM
MKSVSYTEARDHLKDLIDQVNEDHVPVRIQRRNGEAAVILAASDFAGIQETVYLLGNPANAQRLLDARQRTHLEAMSWDEVKQEFER